MTYQTVSLTITGVAPLLMHSGELADPLSRFAKMIKSVSGKRSKTDADFIELGRIEWFGSLWLSGGRPCIPGEAFEGMLIEAARKRKRGQQAKAGILCPDNYPLVYDGPADLDALWEDKNFRLRCGVKVQRSRIIRTRPRFPAWSAVIAVNYLPSLLNEREVIEIAGLAGEIVGVGDWRPKFGRFSVDVT